jgi:hypothetical protein
MSKRVLLAVVAGGFLGFVGLAAAPASAQATDTVPVAPPTESPTVDQVDRAANGLVRPERGPGGTGAFRAPEGVGLVRPGALLFASFDANHDGKVTIAEIEAAAPGVFAVADKNKDGAITGFEQTDWAASMGGLPDILANPMTFDVDLDNKISPAEFTGALKRIAGQLAPSGEITFAELVRPLNRNDEKGPPGPGFGLGTLTTRSGGKVSTGHPNIVSDR